MPNIKGDQINVGSGPKQIVQLDNSGNLDTTGSDIVTSAESGAINTDQIRLVGGDNTYAGGYYFAGHVRLYGGAGTNGNYGGAIDLTGGSSDGNGNNSYGGYINIRGGAGTNGAYGGHVYIQGGEHTGNEYAGGTYVDGGFLQATSGSPALAGNVRISGGSAALSSGKGGTVRLVGGTAAANRPAGKITITPGGGALATPGVIEVHAPNAQTGEAAIQFWRDTNNNHTTGNYVSVGVQPGLSTNVDFNLPTGNGTADYVLQTDGSGNTSWVPSQDLGEFTVAGLPSAATHANSYALATDASGGRTIVRSDGTNWKVVVVEGATVTT